jgi:hypothetical protein
MVRVTLQWPRHPDAAPHIRTRDDIHNVVVALFRAGGVPPDRLAGQPASWGFGAWAHPTRPGPGRWVSQIAVGTPDPELGAILAAASREDWAGAARRWPLAASVRVDRTWWATVTMLAVRPVSPIRVLAAVPGARRSHALLEPGPAWTDALNRVMSRRFGRAFALDAMFDGDWWSVAGPRTVARMAVKVLPSGRELVLPGILCPLVLRGPNRDLRDAWFGGLGSGTAMGFGWLEVTIG